MRGLNKVFFTGNLGSIVFSETKNKDKVCNFIVYSEKVANKPVKIKANAYGEIAELISKVATKGDHIELVGEIINRELKFSEDISVEVKITESPVIIKKQYQDQPIVENVKELLQSNYELKMLCDVLEKKNKELEQQILEIKRGKV